MGPEWKTEQANKKLGVNSGSNEPVIILPTSSAIHTSSQRNPGSQSATSAALEATLGQLHDYGSLHANRVIARAHNPSYPFVHFVGIAEFGLLNIQRFNAQLRGIEHEDLQFKTSSVNITCHSAKLAHVMPMKALVVCRGCYEKHVVILFYETHVQMLGWS